MPRAKTEPWYVLLNVHPSSFDVTFKAQLVYDNNDLRGQSAGGSDLYDEPAFNAASSKENPLFAEQSTYEGGDYGDYGQPDYADYNYPNGETGYNYMGADATYGNDGAGADEFGAVAGAVMASSQPTYGNDMPESTYGNDDAAGFMMTGGFGDAADAEMGGVDGYLDVNPDINPDAIYAND